MRYTPFAGLTQLDPADSIAEDGASFQSRNPPVTDHFLAIGALSHRHDAHAGLASPSAPIIGAVLGSAGSLDGSSDFAITYTLIDDQGGETLPAPAITLSTGEQTPAPTDAILAIVDFSAGIMPAGTYFYAKTITDGAGGETTIGPTTLAHIETGHASGQVQLSNLAHDVPWDGTWRLWRSYEGGDWHLTAEDNSDTFTDTGFDPPDNPARPPSANSTGQTWALTLTLPTVDSEPAIANAAGFNIYLAPDTSFQSPSLYAQLPITSAGATVNVTDAVVSDGRPPPASTAIGGAAKIDPDSDMIDFPWKRTAANSAGLPLDANEDGDVRETLNDHALQVWHEDLGAWVPVGLPPGFPWKPPVATSADLPTDGSDGDVRETLNDHTLHIWHEDLLEWTSVGGGGGGGGSGSVLSTEVYLDGLGGVMLDPDNPLGMTVTLGSGAFLLPAAALYVVEYTWSRTMDLTQAGGRLPLASAGMLFEIGMNFAYDYVIGTTVDDPGQALRGVASDSSRMSTALIMEGAPWVVPPLVCRAVFPAAGPLAPLFSDGTFDDTPDTYVRISVQGMIMRAIDLNYASAEQLFYPQDAMTLVITQVN